MFGDLGALLAQEIRTRIASLPAKLEPSTEGIRATVIGASQYTTQVSGSTIYVSPMEALPRRTVPVRCSWAARICSSVHGVRGT